jgi:hypothetical protein
MASGEKECHPPAPAKAGDGKVADEALSAQVLKGNLEVRDGLVVANGVDPGRGGWMRLFRELPLAREHVWTCRQVAGAGVLVWCSHPWSAVTLLLDWDARRKEGTECGAGAQAASHKLALRSGVAPRIRTK